MLISYYANKKSSPRLPLWQPSLIFFNIPIESGSIIKPCTLKHFQVPYRLHKAGYWTIPPTPMLQCTRRTLTWRNLLLVHQNTRLDLLFRLVTSGPPPLVEVVRLTSAKASLGHRLDPPWLWLWVPLKCNLFNAQ